MRKDEAIYAIYPNVVSIRGDVAYDKDENIIQYDEATVQSLMLSKQYISHRALEYPPIGDQLDDLFHSGAFSEEMRAKIQAIKDKYPKS